MSVVKQVGGDHYQAKTQHWDLMEQYDIGYLEATATKYILRFDRKGKPREDLLKAKSYLDRIAQEGRDVRRKVPVDALNRFLTDNELDGPESKRKRVWLKSILCWGDNGLLADVSHHLGQQALRYPE